MLSICIYVLMSVYICAPNSVFFNYLSLISLIRLSVNSNLKQHYVAFPSVINVGGMRKSAKVKIYFASSIKKNSHIVDESDDETRAAEPAAEPAHSADKDDDDVFEDFFSSPAHRRQKTKRATCSSLQMDTNIEIPFELDSLNKKRKPRRSGLETSSKKKKVDESDGEREHPSVPRWQNKETLECCSANVTPVVKRLRQSTLSFPSARSTNGAARRRASTSSLSVKTMETRSPAGLRTHPAASVHCQVLESE